MKLLQNKTLALIIPVYNESEALVNNYKEIKHILEKDGIEASFLFIDDGSVDNTWAIIEALSEEFNDVNGIKFARNFGKEIALSAGIDSIDADYYVVMDADLQHPPNMILPMLTKMETSGVDIVEGVKASRGKESLKYRLVAKSFYKFLYRISGMDMNNSSDFKLMNRKVIDSLRSFHERHVFFRGVVDWVGFQTEEITFDVAERHGGESHFSTFKLIKLALTAIFSHTSRPLFLTVFIGGIFMAFAVALGGQTLYNYIVGNAVDGFSTVILLLLITGSFIMMSLGIIGVYISRIYEEVKQRPKYIIDKRVRLNEK